MAEWREVKTGESGSVRFALVAGPGDHSVLQSIAAAGLQQIVHAAPYQVFQPSTEEFEECVRSLAEQGYRGLNVGNPHKVFAARLAEKFFMVRDSMGLANALSLDSSGIYGKNTEVSGFTQTVSHLTPGTALVMGAGQGARSVVMGLLQSGWKVKLWNRNAMKSRLLQTTFNRFGSMELLTQADPSGCNLVVNATPLGVKAGEEPPLVWRYVRPGLVCYDLVYRRVATEFLRNASLKGLKVIDGRELVVEQAAEAIEWWTGTTIDREPMRQAAGLKHRNVLSAQN